MVPFKQRAWKRAWPVFGLRIAAVVASAGLAADVGAQSLPPSPPVTRVSMDDAVRLTVERNQTLRGQRLTIDESKADETTAALRPNPGFSFDADGLTPFSPRQMNLDFLENTVSYTSALSYTFERGGKRAKRTTVAEDTTDVTRKTVIDSRAAAALPGGAGVRRRPARQVDARARAAGSQELLGGRRDQSPARGGGRPGARATSTRSRSRSWSSSRMCRPHRST